jgi:transposase
MLQPVVRRTWAPLGQTPILRQWDRRDRLSAISALTVAPRRRRFGLYWALYRHNIRTPEVLRFLQLLRRHLPRGFTLLWDRGRPHRATRVATWLATYAETIRVEWLPPYAPDLNPAEHIWSHTKHGDLANFTPADLDHLEGAVVTSLARKRTQRQLLAAFFHGAGLDL